MIGLPLISFTTSSSASSLLSFSLFSRKKLITLSSAAGASGSDPLFHSLPAPLRRSPTNWVFSGQQVHLPRTLLPTSLVLLSLLSHFLSTNHPSYAGGPINPFKLKYSRWFSRLLGVNRSYNLGRLWMIVSVFIRQFDSRVNSCPNESSKNWSSEVDPDGFIVSYCYCWSEGSHWIH